MTPEELKKLIKQGEGLQLEFKQNFSNDSIISLSSFANTKGGKLIIGVSDYGEIMGINIEKETVQNWINETKNKTSPSIIPYVETIVTDKLTVAVILVQEFPIKPIAFKGRYYKRMYAVYNQPDKSCFRDNRRKDTTERDI